MLTLDPSTTDTGYAVFCNGNLIGYSDINISDVTDINKRVNQMIVAIWDLFKRFKPNICIIEGLTVFNDIKTDSSLSDIIGAVKGFSLTTGCWYDKLFPSEWRKLISTDEEKIPMKRIDCKPWDIEKLKALLNINTDNDNIADAVLIGLAYINLFGNNSEAEPI